jgi:hypothetical protein
MTLIVGGILLVSLVLLVLPAPTGAQQVAPVRNELWQLHPVPKGNIAFWAGDEATIPQGWQFCDGSNGTPDLRDRFVRGAQSPGGTGGSDTLQLSPGIIPEHGHGFTTDSGGVHNHLLEDHYRQTVLYCTDYSYSGECAATPLLEWPTGIDADGLHSHKGTTDSAGLASPLPWDNRPAYYKIAFIMKMY